MHERALYPESKYKYITNILRIDKLVLMKKMKAVLLVCLTATLLSSCQTTKEWGGHFIRNDWDKGGSATTKVSVTEEAPVFKKGYGARGYSSEPDSPLGRWAKQLQEVSGSQTQTVGLELIRHQQKFAA